jgi:hypothetical protein
MRRTCESAGRRNAMRSRTAIVETRAKIYVLHAQRLEQLERRRQSRRSGAGDDGNLWRLIHGGL